jgi:diketogulonate reductase-like aldo/keto reductase
MNLQTQYRLNDQTALPVMGFGTNVLKGGEGIKAIKIALNAGYRLIDTAQSYDNEEEVGRAIQESGIPREEIFITTKITDENQGYQQTLDSVKVSLEKLQTDTVDLLLVHWPNIEDFNRSIETYQALIDLRQQGTVKTIGVSNYTPKLIQDTIDATHVPPAVNQVEFHPFLYQEELLNYCNEREIRIESYCPIARAEKTKNPVMQRLSEKYGKSPVQVILRWHIELGLIPIPRSMDPDHIKANAEVFDFKLTEAEVEELNQLDENYRIVNPEKGPNSW